MTSDAINMEKKMSNIVASQLPFATAITLTKTAQKIMNDEKREMRRVFDRPTPYTTRAVFAKPANKKDTPIMSEVAFRFTATKGTVAEGYLRPHIKGGMRPVKRHERHLRANNILREPMLTAPAKDAPLDRYGNIPAGVYQSILSELGAAAYADTNNQSITKRSRRRKRVRGYYVARKNGRTVGVRQQTGGSSKKILNFITPPMYQPRFDFYGVARKRVNLSLQNTFKYYLKQAIKTAK